MTRTLVEREEWSLCFYGSPPAVFVKAGIPGLPDSRRDIGYMEFPSKAERETTGKLLRKLVAEHNATLSAMPSPDRTLVERVDYVVKMARQYEAALIRVPDAVHGAGERLEQAKRELLSAMPEASDLERCDQCGKRGGGHHPACIFIKGSTL